MPVLFERLKTALDGLPWEMIVVDDDSPDGTYDVAFAIAARDPRLRCLRRVNRSGLAGAVIEGWLSSSADFVAVIDGDLQHDEAILPKMYAALAARRRRSRDRHARADETHARRPVARAPEAQRSRRLVLPPHRRRQGQRPDERLLHDAARDRRRARAALSPDGFKILVDVVLSSGGKLQIVESPYVFRQRQAGESKLSPLVGLDFLGLVAHHATGGVLPTRFVLFALIGGVGLFVHLVVLCALIVASTGASISTAAQIVATIAAMASNFVLNNEITYRIDALSRPRHDRRLPAFSRCFAASARSPTSISPRGCSSRAASGGRRASRARWSASSGTMRRARPSSGAAGAIGA